MPETIQYYRQGDAYGQLSNFAGYPVEVDGKWWPTTEHYYQAQKFAGTPYAEEIRRAPGPGRAAQLGRDHRMPLRADWETVRDEVMMQALRAKFTQHPALKALLQGTGDAILVEHTRNDFYWGDGGNGKGKNMLGVLLMRLREELLHG